MNAPRLTPVDAQTFWMSAKIPNDTFLLFGFAGVPADLDGALDELRVRAAQCAELCVRVDDRGGLAYPAWATGTSTLRSSWCTISKTRTWSGCLATIIELIDDQLDATTVRVAAARLPGGRRRAHGVGRRAPSRCCRSRTRSAVAGVRRCRRR